MSTAAEDETLGIIIGICWLSGSVVGFLPLMGWHRESERCFFLQVMNLNYLVFLYFGTIITPAILLIAFYYHIYQVILKQLRRIVTLNPEKGSTTKGFTSGGTMVRILGVHQTNEVKATQNLAIIVLFFMICWIPLYTINCILAFRPDFPVNSTFMLCCIILSHLNSAGNPILYAYHLTDFRAALKIFFWNLLGKETREDLNRTHFSQYRYQTRKKSSAASLWNGGPDKNKTFSTENLPTLSKYSEMKDKITNDRPENAVIWNISEHSSDSSDSVRPCDHDKSLIIRPPTPYRQIYSKIINPAYSSLQCENQESHSGYLNHENPLNYNEFSSNDNYLNKKARTEMGSQEQCSSLSNFSPQLSRLFSIENNKNKTASWNYTDPNKLLGLNLSDRCFSHNLSFKQSAFKQKNKFEKRGLSRSFSDSGSVTIKYTVSNDILSCGS